jgi:hypothetical protein
LALSILFTVDNSEFPYQFPLTEDDRLRGKELIQKLKVATNLDLVNDFHSFILLILYARKHSINNEEYSKWNKPMECFMALHNLQEDSNFKPPHLVTQFFAHLYYHIRGAMLYEDHKTIGDFDHNLYK